LRDRDYPGNDSAPLDDSRGALFLETALIIAGVLNRCFADGGHAQRRGSSHSNA
jgi:hypothetical protein